MPSSSSANLTSGCKSVTPPIVPIESGISIENINLFSWISALVKLWYLPDLETYACTPASIALKSLPVAIATASIPFITPLL